MLALEIETEALVAEVESLPAVGRWGTSPEQRARVSEAVSLRGAVLVGALLARFGDVDEALAALEDYAGAFESLADFAAVVFAERHPLGPSFELGLEGNAALGSDFFELAGAAMLARGEVFCIALGPDLHLFWRV